MKATRVLLLVFMTFWILLMIGCPGMHDTIRMQRAFNHYYDAPSEETKRELDEARKLDRRDVLIFEIVMALVLGAAIYGFIRVGRKVDSHTA